MSFHQTTSSTLPKLPFPSILCRTKSSIVNLGWWSFLGTAYRGSSSVSSPVIALLPSAGPSHETPCSSAGGGRSGSGNGEQVHDINKTIKKKWKAWLKKKKEIRGCVPLFASVAVGETPVTNPDGARTIPGWLTLTGPSRPMMSVSLMLF